MKRRSRMPFAIKGDHVIQNSPYTTSSLQMTYCFLCYCFRYRVSAVVTLENYVRTLWELHITSHGMGDQGSNPSRGRRPDHYSPASSVDIKNGLGKTMTNISKNRRFLDRDLN